MENVAQDKLVNTQQAKQSQGQQQATSFYSTANKTKYKNKKQCRCDPKENLKYCGLLHLEQHE